MLEFLLFLFLLAGELGDELVSPIDGVLLEPRFLCELHGCRLEDTVHYYGASVWLASAESLM